MIEFYSETDFKIEDTKALNRWISEVVLHENHELGELTYVFCDDEYLHKLNLQFLNHDTLTDIISFDNSLGKQIHGEVYISIERVKENASIYGVAFLEELHRVIIHGVLHFCGYQDKSEKQQEVMRGKENQALGLRTFV
jgi:rRNA maturation RNase YbeY